MTGFGLAHIRGEGAPLHPDDLNYVGDGYDEWYERQLKAYNDYYEIDDKLSKENAP